MVARTAVGPELSGQAPGPFFFSVNEFSVYFINLYVRIFLSLSMNLKECFMSPETFRHVYQRGEIL